jgi:hypothetical protein
MLTKQSTDSAKQLGVQLSSWKALSRERVSTQRDRHGVMMVVVVKELILLLLFYS